MILTGLSGAGRSEAAKHIEDLGWFVIDNLPPELIPQVHIRGDVNAPWRCIAGAIYNVQISGYPTVGFITNPIDPNG